MVLFMGDETDPPTRSDRAAMFREMLRLLGIARWQLKYMPAATAGPTAAAAMQQYMRVWKEYEACDV